MWLTWLENDARNVTSSANGGPSCKQPGRGQRWQGKLLTFEPLTKQCKCQIPIMFHSLSRSLFFGKLYANERVSEAFPMVKSENCWFVFRIHILWVLLGHKRTSLPFASLSLSHALPASLCPAWSHVPLCELGHSWGHSSWQTIQSMWEYFFQNFEQ